MAVQIPRMLLTVAEFERISQAGIWDDDRRVELIKGEMVAMSPIGGPHVWCVNRLATVLGRVVPAEIIISVQNPIILADDTEPQPDIALVRWREDLDFSRPPLAEDVVLVIEVADSSVGYDRDIKMPLYAEAGIPEALLVKLNSKTVTYYAQPDDGEYAIQQDYYQGQAITFQTVPDLVLKVDDVLV